MYIEKERVGWFSQERALPFQRRKENLAPQWGCCGCVCPQMGTFEPGSWCSCTRRWRLTGLQVLRVEPNERDQCTYKRNPEELSSPLEEERSGQPASQKLLLAMMK